MQPKAIRRDPFRMRTSSGQRRWDGVSWWFSLVVPVALVLVALTWSMDGDDDGSSGASTSAMSITVLDASTEQPLQGAKIAFGEEEVVTDQSGVGRFDRPAEVVTVTISSDGYDAQVGSIQSDSPNHALVSLAPVSLAQAPPVQFEASDTTENSSVDADASSQDGHEAEQNRELIVDGMGTVSDFDGDPIAFATVVSDGTVVTTDEAGAFALDDFVAGAELLVYASGYADQTVPYDGGESLSVALDRQDIKALYLSGANLANQARIDEIIATIDQTELNALVVDIKEGYVYYDTQVEFFQEADAVEPIFDPAALVQQLHDHGIYAIARMVVFNDPVVAENRPDLAVQDEKGGAWRGFNGGAWVDPFHEELWDANIALAQEAASFGFDEIQYDYVRFPSDGDLTTADFSGDYSEEGRVSTIVGFLERSDQVLRPMGVKTAADIFAIVTIYPDDQGIGQRPGDIAPFVDYINPMIYPSHFDGNSLALPGHPNYYPYETIELSVALGMQKMPGMEMKLRPWLQDFTLGDPEYGTAEVRAQIDAAMATGATGWMLWNAASEFTVDALQPE